MSRAKDVGHHQTTFNAIKHLHARNRRVNAHLASPPSGRGRCIPSMNTLTELGRTKRRRAVRRKARTRCPDEGDAEGASDDESEIWKALVDLRSELEGEGSDDDLDMGDLESTYDADEEDEEEGEEGSGDEGVIFDDESDEEEEEEPDEIMSEGSAEAPTTAKPKDSKKSKSKDNQQPSDEDGSPDDFSAFSLFPVTRVLTEPGQDLRLEEYDYKGAKKLRNLNIDEKTATPLP